VTTWNYNPLRGFLASKTDAADKSVSYTYTPAGRLATRAWARGTNTTYTYNTAGNLISVSYSDSTPGLTNSYDRLGRKSSVLCGAMPTSFVYDWANDVLSESYAGGVLGGLTVTNQFDPDLRRTNVALLSGASTLCRAIYGYDNASRLASVSDGSNSAAYSYLANSSLVGQIVFQSNTVTSMTTSKQYDYLNRLSSIASTPSNAFTYQYNAANQRTMSQLWDESYWRYGYDALGQVTSGSKFWSDETPVAGQQFDYTFDTIGNRIQTQAGGDQNGANLRLANYTNNALNQITSRGVPSYVDVMGDGLATNGVTVNGSTAYRKNEYFRQQLSVTNTSAVWDSVTVAATGQTSVTGHVYVPQAPENYTYDADGNLLSDGRWNYVWDGENRLLSMTSLSGAPAGSQLQLLFTYDYQGRRIQKLVSTNNGSSYIGEYTNKYAYDGWNCLAVLTPSLSLSNSFLWGSDLSGSVQGAGGVGGLIKMAYYGATTTNCFVAFDGNGNVSALVNAANGTTVANYDYGPFGEVIRETGPMAKLNPFRFSSKYDDDESDFLYYGYRYYNPSTGKWLSRDPIGEAGFVTLTENLFADDHLLIGSRDINLYSFVGNDSENDSDVCGLCGSDQPPPQCGKEVSIDMWLTQANVEQTYQGASLWTRYLAGLAMFNPIFGSANSWDILWLSVNSDFGGDPVACPYTVSYDGYCVSKDELNYEMYGWGVRLEHGSEMLILRRLYHLLQLRARFGLSSDTPAVIDRKVRFAEVGGGFRDMGPDLAYPCSCVYNSTMYTGALPTDWKWNYIKN
jgi:RHS repeat-associated protein